MTSYGTGDISDEAREGLGLGPDRKAYAKRAADVLAQVDPTNLDDLGKAVFGLALAATAVAVSIGGLDEMGKVATWLEQIAGR